MRQRFGAIAATGILTAVLVGWAAARPQQAGQINLPPMNGVVKTPQDAYLLLAPEFVAGPNVINVEPSKNHDFLLITRESRSVTPPLAPVKPQSEVNLILWDMRTRKSTVLWRGASNEAQMISLQETSWVPGTPDIALVNIITMSAKGSIETDAQSRVLRVDARAGTAKTLAVTPAYSNLIVSDTQPLTATVSRDGVLRLLRLASGLGRSIPIPAGTRMMRWLPDGKRLLGSKTVKQQDGSLLGMSILVNVETGAVTEIKDRKELKALLTAPGAEPFEPELPPLRVVTGSGKLNAPGGATMDLRPLWLSGITKDAEGSALLTPDGERPQVLRNSALFYRQGALYAAPIEKLDRTAYEKLRREVLRRQAMNNAKQIGLAMMMYAQDYDENFPPNGDGVRDQIQPYLKNESVFLNPETGQLGFTLASYTDTSLGSIQQPATTPMGYLTGPGGRAIIFFDGHVRWEDLP